MTDNQLTPIGFTNSVWHNYKEYERDVCYALQAKNGSAWALGDLYNQGQRMFGDDIEQAFEETRISYKTLQNYARVARGFVHGRRRTELSFSHHDVVLAIENDEYMQDMFLQDAIINDWSRDTLRDKVNEYLGNEVSQVTRYEYSVLRDAGGNAYALLPDVPSDVETVTVSFKTVIIEASEDVDSDTAIDS